MTITVLVATGFLSVFASNELLSTMPFRSCPIPLASLYHTLSACRQLHWFSPPRKLHRGSSATDSSMGPPLQRTTT
ncbi:uncharacterized protein F5147DRAFT_682678 [Suillus discolor]|uniref:Secreted protein n=1 Tax=Suillus discolor TaxID=1912936 RepID=A0A9P7JX83_9AGAM|nr:uncharacterized protein F5147DRAFT_682678 [Suillus discolor]KAG2113090.1 hypothetical protein F5147DRAFT_682678 [Suillus discolor]